MPKPREGESRDDFISRFMSSEEAKKDYPDKDQRLAVAQSMWRKHQKKEKQGHVGGIILKEIAERLEIGGFIATTHLDSGFYDEDDEVYYRDRVSKETLDMWANELNKGIPRANKISIRHNRRDPVVAGAAIKGTAKVMQLPDGEYGLYVESVMDSTHDTFETTKHRLDIGTYDGFSIEFTADQVETIEKGEYTERVLLPGCTLHGYAIASRPMNEYAVRIKEIPEFKESLNIKEETTKMTQETEQEPLKKEEEEAQEEAPQEPEPEQPQKDEEPVEKETTKEEPKMDEKEYQEFLKFKQAQKEEAAKEELKSTIAAEVKEALKGLQVEDKIKPQAKAEEPQEALEVKEWREVVSQKAEKMANGMVRYKHSVDQMMQKAAQLSDKLGLTANGRIATTSSAESRIGTFHKNFTTNGTVLECKGLGLTTNQNSDTDYLQSAAELSDVYDPVIYNVLNQATVFWNVLRKEDYSMKGNNQVQFVLKTAANTSAGFYTGDAISLANVTRQKYQTKFKKLAVGVSVSGDMIAAARGGPVGDVFAQEVMDSAEDMLAVLNAALFAETGAETAAAVIGLEYITDQAGNTTLYNVTRSQANGLASTTTADNYVNGSSQDVSLGNLRAAKRKALKEGAMISDLVYVTDHIQGDKIRGIYDASQRVMPTSSRFGFEGMPEFDGIPIFEDKDCNTDDIFLVDLSVFKVAIWVPPTLEMMGKNSDAEKGFIKMYLATYCTAPRRLVQIYSNATS